MQVIPAVDIMRGGVVRLTQGDPGKRTDYGSRTPLQAAKQWEAEGAERIHVIDLDAALESGENRATVEKLVKGVGVPLQVGGGIRTQQTAGAFLHMGVDRVILGSLTFSEPEAVKELVSKYGPGRVIVSLDHRGGIVQSRGWTASTGMTVLEALKLCKGIGVELFLVTDVERDGSFTGPDVDTVRSASKKCRVIAAGGIASLDDLKALKKAGAEAAVVGKALYEGVFTLREAKEAAA